MVIKNGTVVTGKEILKSDLRIQGGKIGKIAASICPGENETVIDAAGMFLLPGGIDAHTHFDMPAGNDDMTADDFLSGTKAAIAGGTTTILDFAEPQKGESLAEGLAAWHRKADGRSFCDYGFHMTVSSWNVDRPGGIEEMESAGIASLKAYTAYKDDIGLDDREMYRLMENAAAAGAIVMVHCENGDLIEERTGKLLETAPAHVMSHALSRPNLVEKEAVSRVIDIAAIAGAYVYIVHVSTAESMRVIKEARKRGQHVYAETCPQYLLLCEEKYKTDGTEGAKFVGPPPLRKEADQEALWQALADKELDVISTDHCSFSERGQKDRGIGDFTKIPNGLPGVQERMELMYHFGTKHGLELTELAGYTAENAARIFGLYPQKGILAEGSDADIVIMDPKSPHTISASSQLSNAGYTPYEGIRTDWKVKDVFLRGRQYKEDGVLREEAPDGKYLAQNNIFNRR